MLILPILYLIFSVVSVQSLQDARHSGFSPQHQSGSLVIGRFQFKTATTKTFPRQQSFKIRKRKRQ